MKKFFNFSVIFTSIFLLFTNINSKPIIGILTNPLIDDTDDIKEAFITSNYVKWLEAAGAEIVPIHSWFSPIELDEILGKLNGVLFQGGSVNLRLNSTYMKATSQIFQRVIYEKDIKNKTLPLWGTCLGFETLHVLVAKTKSILTNFNSFNVSTPIEIVSNGNKLFRLFSLFSDLDILNIKTKSNTAQFHHFGVEPDNFNKNQELVRLFNATSFGLDQDSKLYIASIEGINYPMYALQFHPEKTNFDRFEIDQIPQGIDAVRISNNFANFFVQEARKNKNVMSKEDINKFGLINSFETRVSKTNSSITYRYVKNLSLYKKLKFLE